MGRELVIYIDGACSGNPGEAGIGVVIFEDERIVKEVSRAIGHGTNNIAEYSAFLCALEEASNLKADTLNIFTDSELLFKQATGQYKIKNENLKELLAQAKKISKGFEKVTLKHVPREQNKLADKLATDSIKNKKFSVKEESDKTIFA